MGFIPLFLTVGGACMLFFLTVKNSMQRKLNLQRELTSKLSLSHPNLGILLGEIVNPDTVWEALKNSDSKVSEKSMRIVREMKFNRLKYNELIKKAPYNWVAKLSGFQPI